nr:T-lymphocyte surface antigen Ly-9-like isoform X4 [Zootoca vivipara]
MHQDLSSDCGQGLLESKKSQKCLQHQHQQESIRHSSSALLLMETAQARRGSLSHAVRNPPQQVNGILGGSVSFPANVSQGIKVKKIEWDFLPKYGGRAFRLSEYRHGKPDHPNPTDRFGERLDMANQKILRIKDLEFNDSGLYGARVWFTKSLFQGQSFSLTVYEPVATPQIDHHVESKTPGGCHVTLRCHTSGREEINISWGTGGPHRALGKSVNRCQVSENGQEHRVFYWNSSFDSKFTCLVSNPVDQKGASFELLNICQTDEETLSHAVGNPTHQVKGILGGSVLFPANVSLGITVEKIEWDFRPQRHGIDYWLGEFRHGKWAYRSPPDRFGQRLDLVEGTTLRLKDLELDDGGIYNTRIWFTKAQFQEQRFSLTVYELVPTPQIDHHVESKTPGGCNVTLQCHTPGRKELKVSWETGVPHRGLGKAVNQFQVSDNGRELRVFYWNRSFDSKFTCVVSNPVDQKRASFDLLKICQSYEGIHSVMQKKGYSTLTFQNSKRSKPEDGDDEVDSDREDFSSSSKLPRGSFPSLGSYAISETEPSEVEYCIPQTNMGDQAHLLEPLPRNSLKVPQGKEPLKTSQCSQLSRNYSLPSTFEHWSQESLDHAKEQRNHSCPVNAVGVSLRARKVRKRPGLWSY